MTPGRLKVWNEDAGEWQYTPGGSQPGAMRLVDLGTVAGADLDGITTIYDAAAGETIVAILVAYAAGTGGQQNLIFGSQQNLEDVATENNADLGFARCGASNDGFDSYGNLPNLDFRAVQVFTGDVKGGMFTGSPGYLPGVAPNWQAAHTYAPGSNVIALLDQGDGPVPTVFTTSAGGVSGLTEPTWQTNPTQTTDGTILWDDISIVDVDLAADVRLLVAAAT